jgi:hypothetical protein
MKLNYSVEGLADIQKAFNRKISKVESYTPNALMDVGNDLQGKAQQLAPVDTGDLRGSAYTKLGKNSVEVGFNTPYALRQHEELNYRHPRGGQAKYLEEPFKENKNKYIDHIKNSTKKAVEE